MDAKTIKNFFKTNFGLSTRVSSKKRFVQVWADGRDFPLDIRVKALTIIYGPTFDSANGNAGNVNSRGIAMTRDEWTKLVST